MFADDTSPVTESAEQLWCLATECGRVCIGKNFGIERGKKQSHDGWYRTKGFKIFASNSKQQIFNSFEMLVFLGETDICYFFIQFHV